MSNKIDLSKDYVYHGTFGTLKVKHHFTAWAIDINLKDNSDFPIEQISLYRYFYHKILDDGTISYGQNVYAKDLAEQMVTEVIRYDRLAAFK